MSWTRTRRYYRTLLDVEAEVNRTRDGVLPWREEYADVFGTPVGLRQALRHHWELQLRTQLDCDADRDDTLRRLTREHSGLLLALYCGELPTTGRELVSAAGAA